MALTVKVRRGGRGVVVSIPSALARLVELNAGDEVAWEVLDDRAGVLRLRRVVKAEQLER